MPRSVIHNQDVFFQRMKKKPALQGILDNLSAFTEADLLSLPDQPLWIRQQLVKLKQREGLTSTQVAEKLADAMMAAAPQQTTQPQREVREWRLDPAFVGGGVHGDFAMEIEPGDLVLLLPPHTDVTTTRGVTMSSVHYEAKVGATVIKLTPAQWTVLLQSSALVGMMTVKEYGEEVQRRLSVKHG